jgi:hypothetical protein
VRGRAPRPSEVPAADDEVPAQRLGLAEHRFDALEPRPALGQLRDGRHDGLETPGHIHRRARQLLGRLDGSLFIDEVRLVEGEEDLEDARAEPEREAGRVVVVGPALQLLHHPPGEPCLRQEAVDQECAQLRGKRMGPSAQGLQFSSRVEERHVVMRLAHPDVAVPGARVPDLIVARHDTALAVLDDALDGFEVAQQEVDGAAVHREPDSPVDPRPPLARLRHAPGLAGVIPAPRHLGQAVPVERRGTVEHAEVEVGVGLAVAARDRPAENHAFHATYAANFFRQTAEPTGNVECHAISLGHNKCATASASALRPSAALRSLAPSSPAQRANVPSRSTSSMARRRSAAPAGAEPAWSA